MKYFDIFGCDPQLFIYGEKRYKTSFGSLMSIITLTAILAFVFYFFIEMINRNKINLISNQKTKFNNTLDLSDYPFMFKIATVKGDAFKNTIVLPIVNVWTYPPMSNGTPIIETVKVETCDINIHFGKFKDLFTKLNGIETHYCLPPGSFKTLTGIEGDLINGYTRFFIYITTCTNSTSTKAQCDTDAVIIKSLTDISPYMFIYAIDYEIDNENNKQPMQPYVKLNRLLLSPQAKYRHTLNLKKIFYTSDDGFVFEDNTQFEFFQHTPIMSDLYIGNTFNIKEAFGIFAFSGNYIGDFHVRTYAKLQALLANVGGVVNALVTSARIIVVFFTEQMVVIKYSNETVIHDEDKKKTNIIHSSILKQFNSVTISNAELNNIRIKQ
jgi:hypothetical protein